MNLSLTNIIRDNPDLTKRLEEGTKEVRKSKTNLVQAANNFNNKYTDEIEEGTRRRQILLENGKEVGKTEEEVLGTCGGFIPSVRTPIMNFLFFMMRDGNRSDWVGIQKDLNEQYGHIDTNLEEVVSEKELDQLYGQLIHDDAQYKNVNEPEEMDRFIYGDMSHDLFIKIKKLKALSRSDNQNEAFLAYQICMRLCRKFGLEIDKIPCNIK